MLITKLQGGLGNQMFQYALGRKLSLKLGVELLLDTTAYGPTATGVDGRPYGLGHFNVTGRPATAEEIRAKAFPYGVFIKKVKDRFDRAFLGHNHIKFEPWMLEKTGDIYLDGFWQSYKYFENIRDVLLKDFSLRKPLSSAAEAIAADIRREMQSVSLHVRRGDYVSNKENMAVYGNYCDQKYYTKALETVGNSQNRATGKPHVFVFSDDVEWVKKNISIPYPATYIAPNATPDYEQMMLMSLCQAHIIANSTFSWWGAWLDEKNDRMVVAPSVWTPGIDLPIDDILPPEWIRV